MKKKSNSRPVRCSFSKGGSACSSLRAIVIVICSATACLVLAGKLSATAGRLAWLHPEPTKVSYRALTFAERVAYQRAIEEVYWRQRIWPKERPDHKPSLDAVMSHAQLEKKVADYLRNSQALGDYWQPPFTAEQLQAEMERIAKHTKQPEVLHELFEALGNDPFVIAECLARPILTERVVGEFNSGAKDASFRAKSRNPAARLRANSTGSFDSAQDDIAANLGNRPYHLPVIADPSGGCIDDTWTATSTSNAPSARYGHTAVWTGTEMIVWGGYGSNVLNTGGRYDPSTDSWTATSTANAPTARYGHTAVWTGSEMIVWGGDASFGIGTGGRYNPITDSWTATSTTNAPSSRGGHTAVWTGSEMIVWGGVDLIGRYWNTGGRYNPSTDSWTATSIASAPSGRARHTAVWADREMIVWGGFNGGYFNTGGRYNPITDSWTATSTTNAPSSRGGHTVVWTGSEMIVWGGYNGSFLNAGGRYNPGTNSWTATSITNAPNARAGHTGMWTGSEMIVWGGYVYNPNQDFNTGGRYNPGTDSWTATSTTNAPHARDTHTAVWTSDEMIVWGGADVDANIFNTGGRYCAQAGPTPTPGGRPTPTSRPRPTPAPRPSP
jgi:N-acetylneuraminic acid mutarotase